MIEVHRLLLRRALLVWAVLRSYEASVGSGATAGELRDFKVRWCLRPRRDLVTLLQAMERGFGHRRVERLAGGQYVAPFADGRG